MNPIPTITNLTIYPIKSLDGIALQKAMITKGGCLLHDRAFAIADLNGNFIIGKNNPLVHTLRSSVDVEQEIVSFRQQNDSAWTSFRVHDEKALLDAYLTAHFKMPVTLLQNKEGRFLDMPDVSGVTILSSSSLNSVSGWYNSMDIAQLRKRFRATIEIESTVPFWEDHLFSSPGKSIEFTIGEATLFGISPRARCIVPTRDADTGESTPAFPKTFSTNRAAELPTWSHLMSYGHHYHLTVNCYIPPTEIGKWLHIGDEVRVVGEADGLF